MLFDILYDISKYIPILHNGLEFRLCNKQTNKAWRLHKHKHDIIKLSNDKYIDIQIIEFMKQYNYLYFHIVFSNISNDLLTRISTSFGNLQNLHTLDLGSNQLTSIPYYVGDLQNLQILDLSNNQLTNIPYCVGDLQNLHTLYLSNNQLTHIPSTLGNLQNLKIYK